MAKTMLERRGCGDGRDRLRAWYLDSLGPRLTDAANARTVAPAAAHALDLQMRGLLDLPDARTGGATDAPVDT